MSCKGLYKFGGAAALIAIPIFLMDFIISFGGGDINPHTLTAVDWFTLFNENGLLGLRMLGLINIISLTATIPLYMAIYAAHKQVSKALAAFALILYFVGTAIYISNNTAIPMFVMSGKYMNAATEVQKSLYAAAGEAIVATGADFTPGSFIGFFFTEAAGIVFSLVMLRGRIFSTKTACAGILGFASLTLFTISMTFIPVLYDAAMIIAMLGGISCMVWYILTGRRLLMMHKLQEPNQGGLL